MMNKKIIGLLIFLPFLGSCITEIEFETEVDNFLVIGGVISNSLTEKTITVGRTTGIGTAEQGVEASGRVYKDGQVWEELFPDGTGVLKVPAFQTLDVGSTYFVEIEADGNVYRSLPQTVQPRLKTEALEFGTAVRETGVNFEGVPINERFVDVFATITVPEIPASGIRPNYRWQVDESWSVVESFSFTENPNPWICYLTNETSFFPSVVLNTRDLVPGTLKVMVASRLMDESFLDRHYFNVYLHSVDTRAIEYYQNATRLINNSGTIFDEVPALVNGNIYNVNDPTDQIMGYVEFSLADTLRLLVNYPELNVDIFDFCVDAEDPCPYLPLPTGGAFRPNCRCYECDSIYGQGTLQKPYYWD